MKILYLCTYYHRAMIFRDAMNYLEARGHELKAFNAVNVGEVVAEKYNIIMDDKVIHKECFHKNDRFFYHLKQRKIYNAIQDAVDIKKYDILHSHTLFNGGYVAYKLHQKTSIPYIVSVRNTDLSVFLKIPGFKKIARKIVDNAAGVLFLSNTYKEAFLNSCYSKKEVLEICRKCTVIPNGLESFWLENKGDIKSASSDGVIRIIVVGKIDRNKNAKAVLQAAKIINSMGRKTQITVVGQVVDEGVYKELLEDENTIVVQYLTKEELIDYYRKHDIFVLPSFNETFGRVYAEAMSQGLPVVYTKGQGFDGIFPEGKVGYSVEAKKPDEIANAILKIMDNYVDVSKNCIIESEVFDWEKIAEKLEIFYKKSLKLDED